MSLEFLQSPQVGSFEEKTPPRFQEVIRRSVIPLLPSYLFVQRTITDMDNGSRDVSERGEKVGHQLLPEGIVFHDSPEKKILVHLESVLASDDRVVELFFGIRLPGKIRIEHTEFQMKLSQRQKS